MNRIGLAAIVIAVLTSCGDDSGGSSDELQIDDAWVRSTPAVVDNAALYMTITSPVDDRLTAVTVDDQVAGKATLHETVTSDASGNSSAGSSDDAMDDAAMNDISTMEHRDTIDLPADVSIAFSPGERHIMLEQLAGPLEAGDTVDLTLEFEQAGSRDVTVEVLDEGPE